MKNYYKNRKTESTYKIVYVTPTQTGVPQTERFVTLECLAKYPNVYDQEIVTLPLTLLSNYYSEEVNRVED